MKCCEIIEIKQKTFKIFKIQPDVPSLQNPTNRYQILEIKRNAIESLKSNKTKTFKIM